MAGETDLSILIREMKPVLNPGEFVFCLCDSLEGTLMLNPMCTFQEEEGVTVILPRQKADAASLPYSSTYAWVTLTVHSSLEAVGLTSAVAAALTRANISCNVVAAYYHDHLFVPVKDADRAMEVLLALTGAGDGQ
jgi:hypothetical protein